MVRDPVVNLPVGLRARFPEVPAAAGHHVRWACAAYSTRVPGSRRDDDELLARPVGPLHFGGEHTAGQWAGLMEGALRSGLRAAREVLGQ